MDAERGVRYFLGDGAAPIWVPPGETLRMNEADRVRRAVDKRRRQLEMEEILDIDMIRAHRRSMELLRQCEPGERRAYALYQAWCVGSGEKVTPWNLLPSEIRAGWLAAADFAEIYQQMMEIDAIVRVL